MSVTEARPVTFYRPDYRVKTPSMRSPDYVQMSTAAAITLGLVPGKMHRTSCTHCLNLLVTYPEGCRANCAYCGLAARARMESAWRDRSHDDAAHRGGWIAFDEYYTASQGGQA